MFWFSNSNDDVFKLQNQVSKLEERVKFLEQRPQSQRPTSNPVPNRPVSQPQSQRPTSSMFSRSPPNGKTVKLHEDGTWTLNGAVIK